MRQKPTYMYNSYTERILYVNSRKIELRLHFYKCSALNKPLLTNQTPKIYVCSHKTDVARVALVINVSISGLLFESIP